MSAASRPPSVLPLLKSFRQATPRRSPSVQALRSSSGTLTTQKRAWQPSQAFTRSVQSHKSFVTHQVRHATSRAKPADNPDRGPKSEEDTQTDFNTLDVLGATAPPATAIDEVSDQGFLFDNGLKITDGDGVMLVGGEAFVWRPWMASAPTQPPPQILRGVDLKSQGNGTGGVIVDPGLLKVHPDAWGVLGMVWPKPDLLIVGTGERIVQLDKATRQRLQEFGTRIEVLDTRNAASQFNLLATERGTHEVAAAMLPCGFGVRQKRKS